MTHITLTLRIIILSALLCALDAVARSFHAGHPIAIWTRGAGDYIWASLTRARLSRIR